MGKNLPYLHKKVTEGKASPDEIAKYIELSNPLWDEVKVLKSKYRDLVNKDYDKAMKIKERVRQLYRELTGDEGDFNLDRELCG